jgi:hypothetical protein
MSYSAPTPLRAWLMKLLAHDDAGLADERWGWNNYVADIYAAHARLHDQRRNDRRKQQWKNYERRGKARAG